MARDWGTWLNERRDTLAKELRDQYGGYMPRSTSWQQWQADADDMIERMELHRLDDRPVMTTSDCKDLHETHVDGTPLVPRDHWGGGCPNSPSLP